MSTLCDLNMIYENEVLLQSSVEAFDLSQSMSCILEPLK